MSLQISIFEILSCFFMLSWFFCKCIPPFSFCLSKNSSLQNSFDNQYLSKIYLHCLKKLSQHKIWKIGILSFMMRIHRGIFIFGGGNKRLRNVTKMYCQCQISHKRRKKECLGKFKFSLNRLKEQILRKPIFVSASKGKVIAVFLSQSRTSLRNLTLTIQICDISPSQSFVSTIKYENIFYISTQMQTALLT
jgi:hypothetical protein